MINPETMSILIVDDMKSMRLTMRKMLQNLKIGKTLRFAENGKEGLEILHTARCDIAIIDWNMPVMNGIEMLETIRNDKALRDLPVIMVTAEAERDIVAEVAETEIDGYLLKPLTLSSLDNKIKFVVEKANNPDPATRHRIKARELEENGNFDEAIEQIRIALVHKPSASRLLRQLGLLHFNVGKPDIAEKCLLKAASVNRQDTITRARLAEYYISKNELEKAGRYYLELMTLSMRYFDQALDLAEKLLKKGSKKISIELFSKIIALSRKYILIREKVIDICMANDEIEFPLQLLEQSIKENPSNYDIVYKAGEIYLEIGNSEKALEYFLYVDRHVRGHEDAKFNIAKIYFADQKLLQADDYLNQIIRINPKHKAAIDLRKEI
ncbi:MAG: two component system response regulator [Desulfobacula sp. RIFOXYA12_FULL_46_16]|nr:MAG: two component system response regulator [Deltaproteobacteria bacterium RIFOXYC2_FULL_48_10]OGR21100.1 MAG: two component system response regulator [Desulfobacula sp. RIFOXYA12_FULL_46_16]OGR58796.1 MAG: two component system response regulator [Desulfobacula sp. RIFOXYB2_FULL_45_6]